MASQAYHHPYYYNDQTARSRHVSGEFHRPTPSTTQHHPAYHSYATPPVQQQHVSPSMAPSHHHHHPGTPFRGVLKDPTDSNARAWAEYYSKGGTDPAGLVYFHPETIQGWPTAPPPQRFEPQSNTQQPSYPYSQPPERGRVPSGSFQNGGYQSSPYRHAYSQSLPQAPYPYTDAPQSATTPPRAYEIKSSPSPHKYDTMPSPQQQQHQGYTTQWGQSVTVTSSLSNRNTSRSPSRPLPQPTGKSPSRPQSMSGLPRVPPSSSFPPGTVPPVHIPPTLGSPSLAGSTNVNSSSPTSSRFVPSSSFPANSGSVRTIPSVPSTVSSRSSTVSVGSMGPSSRRPLPSPTRTGVTPPGSAAETPSSSVLANGVNPLDAFAAVQARKTETAPAKRALPPVRSSTLPPTPGATMDGGRPLPTPGARVEGGRPLPSPVVDKGKGKAKATQFDEDETPGSPYAEYAFEPLPEPPSEPSPEPPAGPTPEEKLAMHKAEAHRRMQEKLEKLKMFRKKSFVRPNATEPVEATPVATVEESVPEDGFDASIDAGVVNDIPQQVEPMAEVEMMDESSIPEEAPQLPLVDEPIPVDSSEVAESTLVGSGKPANLPEARFYRPLPPRKRGSRASLGADKASAEIEVEEPKSTVHVEEHKPSPAPAVETKPSPPPVKTQPHVTPPSVARSPSAFARSPSAFSKNRPSSVASAVSSLGEFSTRTTSTPASSLSSRGSPAARPASSHSETRSPPLPDVRSSGTISPATSSLVSSVSEKLPSVVPSTPSTPGLTEAETSSGTSGISDLDTPTQEDDEEEEEEEESVAQVPPTQAAPQGSPPRASYVRSPPETPRQAHNSSSRALQQGPAQSMAMRLATMALREEREEAKRASASPPSTSQRTSAVPSTSYASTPTRAQPQNNGAKRDEYNLDDKPPSPVRRTPSPSPARPLPTPIRSTPASTSQPPSGRSGPSASPTPIKRFGVPQSTNSHHGDDDYHIPKANEVPTRPSIPSVGPRQTMQSTPASRPLPRPISKPPTMFSNTPASTSVPSVPVINLPDDEPTKPSAAPSVTVSAPSITVSDAPTIALSTSNSPSSSPTTSRRQPLSQTTNTHTHAYATNGHPTTPTRPYTSTSSRPSPSTYTPTPRASTVGPTSQSSSPQGPAVLRKGSLRCASCNGLIVGRIVSAMGRRWHPACFKCTECGELLEHVSSYEHEGKAYCHLDYHELFAPQCYHCKTSIADERFVTVTDPGLDNGKTRYYHELHFFCAECGDPFLHPSASLTAPKGERPSPHEDSANDLGYTVYKGHAYCEACHVRLRMPKCCGCGKSIREEVVEALDKKWHFACFVCKSCKVPFEEPSFFQRGEDAYCDRCYRIMLKSEM